MSSKPMSQSVIVNPAIFSEAETLERRHRRRLAAGWIAAITFVAAFSIYGFNYYTLSAIERPFSPKHALLRPSGAVGNRLALLLQIRGDSRDGFLDYDRGHAQRVCRTIPVCANPAKLECCGAFRPGDQGDGGQTLWGRGRKTWPNRRRPRRIVGLAFVRAGRSNIDCDRPLVDDLARSQAAVPSFTSAPAGRGFRSVDHLTLWNSAHAQFPTRVGHSDGAEAGIAVQARPVPLPNQAGFFPLARCPPSV